MCEMPPRSPTLRDACEMPAKCHIGSPPRPPALCPRRFLLHAAALHTAACPTLALPHLCSAAGSLPSFRAARDLDCRVAVPPRRCALLPLSHAVLESLWQSADAEATIATYLSSLTDGSQRFCTREAQITHKQLIKEQRKAGGKANAPKVVAAMEAQKGKGI